MFFGQQLILNINPKRWIVPLLLLALSTYVAAGAGDLQLTPIEPQPEPLGRLALKLSWMKDHKVRGIWIGNGLFETSADEAGKTQAEVIADAGFNLACVSMGVNTNNERSGVMDASKPIEEKYDRTKSTDLDTRLAPNVQAAHRAGLAMMVVWHYGSQHLEPYRKYRSFQTGKLAEITCCPLEETYIAGQHVGNWAERIAQGGADGMVLDMEMYHSDNSWPEGPCICDDCFATYLKTVAGPEWQKLYDHVPAEQRAAWLNEQKAADHYATFAARRTEKLYDAIRQRCQKINPQFFFGVAPQLSHFPGVERGLGTASVPCLVFSEHEYNCGAHRGSFMGAKVARESLPALYLCGAYVAVQPPELMAQNVINSALYCDGWWAWYGTALLTDTAAGESPPAPYGRVEGTAARDYLDRLTAAHEELDRLLKLPPGRWPARQDQKLPWLESQLAKAKTEADQSGSPQSAKALSEAAEELDRYRALLKQDTR